MSWNKKQYYVEYESDVYDAKRYNPVTDDYGSYVHTFSSNSSTISGAKTYIKRIRKTKADENPRNFRIYDMWGEIDSKTNHVPCVYEEK